MEIKYKNTLDQQLLKAAKNQWRYAKQRSIKTLLICLFFSVGFLLWGLLPANSSGFWNFKTSMGIAYTILVLIYALSLYQSRTQWISNCAKAIDHKNKVCIEYTFTDEKIFIKDSESYGESNWTAITGYRIHDNFLFLYIRSLESTWFTIDRNDMPESDFATLVAFVSNKIPLKK